MSKKGKRASNSRALGTPINEHKIMLMGSWDANKWA